LSFVAARCRSSALTRLVEDTLSRESSVGSAREPGDFFVVAEALHFYFYTDQGISIFSFTFLALLPLSEPTMQPVSNSFVLEMPASLPSQVNETLSHFFSVW